MLITRRGLLGGMAALFAAPAIVRAASLMPVQTAALDPVAVFFPNDAYLGQPMTLSEIVTRTLRSRTGALVDNATINNALLQRLMTPGHCLRLIHGA